MGVGRGHSHTHTGAAALVGGVHRSVGTGLAANREAKYGGTEQEGGGTKVVNTFVRVARSVSALYEDSYGDGDIGSKRLRVFHTCRKSTRPAHKIARPEERRGITCAMFAYCEAASLFTRNKARQAENQTEKM